MKGKRGEERGRERGSDDEKEGKKAQRRRQKIVCALTPCCGAIYSNTGALFAAEAIS